MTKVKTEEKQTACLFPTFAEWIIIILCVNYKWFKENGEGQGPNSSTSFILSYLQQRDASTSKHIFFRPDQKNCFYEGLDFVVTEKKIGKGQRKCDPLTLVSQFIRVSFSFFLVALLNFNNMYLQNATGILPTTSLIGSIVNRILGQSHTQL